MLSSYDLLLASTHPRSHRCQTHVNRLCLIVNRAPKVLRFVPVHKLCGYAHARQHDFELVVRASIQIRRRDDVVARMRERCDSNELRRLARRGG
jgi:hypothetical protein